MDIKTKILSTRAPKNKSVEIFLMNDQPFTCPYCGARTLEIASFYHTNAKLLINQCLIKDCGFICGEEEDKEYLKLWKII